MAYPAHIRGALQMMSYPDPFDQILVERFLQHWGGFDVDQLLLAIQQAPSVEDSDITESGQVEERVFAVFAVAYTGDARARAGLLPLLSSTLANERWASALGLGWLQDERVLPTLFALLSEYLPPHLRFLKPGIPDWRYDDWREVVPALLTRSWRQPAYVQPLQTALQYVLRVLSDENFNAASLMKSLSEDVRDLLEQNWMHYADTIIFALGRLSAFDTLAKMQVPEEHLSKWQVHMAMGFLHDQYPALHIRRWSDRPGLQSAVSNVLQRHFGLDDAELQSALSQYEDEMLTWYRMEPSPWVEGWD